MKIEYETNKYSCYYPTIESNDLRYLISEGLRGYTEQKIVKLSELAELLVEDFLQRNPDKLESIAYILDFKGQNHKIVNETH